MSGLDDFGTRLADVEERIANLTIDDLPLAALQRKLEHDWQPTADTFLEPGSVTADLLAPLSVGSARIVTPQAWQIIGAAGQPAFTGTWVNFGAPYQSAGFYKDELGLVHIRGVVKTGAAPPSAVFTLPAGYRPDGDLIFPSWSNNLFAGVIITSLGVVTAQNGSNLSFSISVPPFRAL